MNTNKPVIGISTNTVTIKDLPFKGHENVYVNRNYVEAIIKAGGIPLMLPLTTNLQVIEHYVPMIDGLLLSGGQDVHPTLYNEDPHPLLQDTAQHRDTYDLHLLRQTRAANKPILGICRGMQLINVAFGGTLFQDLSLHQQESNLNHSYNNPQTQGLHEVALKPNTKLKTIFNQPSCIVNSYHHQSVKQIAPDFITNAEAHDGIIEGIESNNGAWVVGVQWHPELMVGSQHESINLFQTLVEEASNTRRKH